MKRVVAALLCLLISALCSCGTNQPASGSNVTHASTAAAEETTAATPSEQSGEDEPQTPPVEDDGTQDTQSAEQTEAQTVTRAERTEAPATEAPAVTEAARTEPAEEKVTQPVTDAPQTEKTPDEVSYTPTGHRLEVIDGITYIDGILIANKTYSLPKSHAPGDLLPHVNDAFAEMKAAAKADGLRLFSKSAYRSYTSQRIIYERYVEQDGVSEADRYSARPGHSEHQSGLAIDVNSTETSFAGTAEAVWLAENCARFGFIIRYPEDKEEITGYMYEPWHIRYVGVELAQELTQQGLCLEEYFGITSAYAE